MGKECYPLARCEGQYIKILTSMQDPAWRSKYGLPPQPLHFPSCFYAGMIVPATESDS